MQHKGRALMSNVIIATANRGALIIRIGFSGPLYYTSNKEPPKK